MNKQIRPAPVRKTVHVDAQGQDLLCGTALEAWLGRMKMRPSFLATEPPEILRTASLAA